MTHMSKVLGLAELDIFQLYLLCRNFVAGQNFGRVHYEEHFKIMF